MPTVSRISFDHGNMWTTAASHGAPENRSAAVLAAAEESRKRVAAAASSGKVGFFGIPELRKDLAAAKRLADAVRKEFRTLVVVGIGGSDLGARALIHALGATSRGAKMDVRFIGANTDPDELAAFAAATDWRKTALNVISKSGDTIEPMSAFLYLREQLIKKVGAKKHARHVVATTDASAGTLRQIADIEGYRTLPVPAAIGGRFSALTVVGLFPAACAGIDVAALVAGAKGERDAFLAGGEPSDCGPAMFAAVQVEAARERGQHVTVLMPYAESLRHVGGWFRQLWAESLGKKLDRREQIVYRGLTPVAALGATDQHSQVQLYAEGPFDKTVTFVEVAKFAHGKLKVPKPYPAIEGVAYMGGHTFERIIHAERAATAQALAAAGRPNATLTLKAVAPRDLGALLFFFMAATACAAELLDVDAYDQPGVEAGKQAMRRMLGRGRG